jgi:hypothetical protein
MKYVEGNTQNYDYLWTDALRIFDELQFTQTSSAGLIIAGDHNLLLLNCQGKRLQCRLFHLED